MRHMLMEKFGELPHEKDKETEYDEYVKEKMKSYV